MCGICGVVSRDPARVPGEAALVRMRDTLVHRGPDDAGLHLAPGVALGVRRLAIVDLSPNGHMPMTTPDGRYTLVYNGEVYDAAAHRPALEARGVRFRSRTDTEVLLHLFAHEGPAMLERLNGMFALAVWDAEARRLFVARDRLGVKPLYYAADGDTLRFASEAKALFAGGLAPAFDPATWSELLCFRYVAGDRTPYAGVRRLLPGHYLTWQDGRLETARWWSLADRARARRDAGDAAADPARWYRDTFDDAIALRRIADVEVGVLLSGGLDSGSVAASLAAQAGAGVASFTVTFDEPGYDEGPLARQVADRWGLAPHALTVPTGELLPRLLEASWLNDEPLAHGNELHLLAIAAHARPHVTVLLSGEGADETLGGYVRYRPLRHPRLLALAGRLPAAPFDALPRTARLGKLARLGALGDGDAWAIHDACELLPGDLRALGAPPAAPSPYRAAVQAEARALHPGDLLRQAMYLDQHTFLVSLLDRNDRMTMGASIECRVPFLDYRLVEGTAALPTRALVGRESKPLLRAALGDRLPAAVLRGRKWGFGVPWARHLREEPALRAIVADLPVWAPAHDVLPRRALERVVREFQAGDRRRDALVRQLVLVRLWHEACVAGRPPAPRAAAASTPASTSARA